MAEKSIVSQEEKASQLQPALAVSQADLVLAQLTTQIKGDLVSLLGPSSITSGRGTYFGKPEVIQKAIDIQRKYHIEPLGNRTDFSYLTRVISIKDFAEHPDLYFTKLTKGFGTFPLDFHLNLLAKNFLRDDGDFSISRGILEFQHRAIFTASNPKYDILSYAINKALIDAGCAEHHTEGYIYIDILTFLKNYDTFVAIGRNEIQDEEILQNSLNSLASMRSIVLGIFKTVTNITIKSPHDFFASEKYSFDDVLQANRTKDFSQDFHNPFQPHNAQEQELFLNIEKFLLSTAKGISKHDIDELIKIQHPEQFIVLVEMLISKIEADETLEKSWIGNLQKPVGEYSTQELIAFATYLARYLIDDYQKIEEMVEDVLMGFAPTSLKGKCTDYTGMSLHIINNYFKLKYPEKFENIYVGFDAQNIGDAYKHCYMKVYGYNSAGLIEVTFIDPTKLAGVAMEDLEITQDIMKAMDASNLPIQIDRTAEDIIIAKLRGSISQPIQITQNNQANVAIVDAETPTVPALSDKKSQSFIGNLLEGLGRKLSILRR